MDLISRYKETNLILLIVQLILFLLAFVNYDRIPACHHDPAMPYANQFHFFQFYLSFVFLFLYSFTFSDRRCILDASVVVGYLQFGGVLWLPWTSTSTSTWVLASTLHVSRKG